MATLKYSLELLATDNVEVSKVTSEIFTEKLYIINQTAGQTRIENVSIGSYNFTKTLEKDKWGLVFTQTENIGNYWAYLSTMDSSNNTFDKLVKLTFTPLDVVKHEKSVKLPKWKMSKFSQISAFNITNSTPLILTLESVNYPYNYTIGLQQPSGSEIFFEGVNSSLNISDIGEWILKVRGEGIGDIIGSVKFTPVFQHVNINPLTFTLEVVDYEVPVSTTFNYDFGIVKQEVKDTGNPSSSYVELCSEIPLRTFGLEGGFVCRSRTEIDSLQINLKSEKEGNILLKSQRFWGISGFTILLVGLLIISRWQKNIQDYYFKLNGDE